MKLFYLLFALIIINYLSLNCQKPNIVWQYDLKSVCFGHSCAGDIDGDGKLEIVFSTYFNDEAIYALNAEDGTLLWKYITNGCNDAAPLIYDVDGDGKPEVLLHSSSNHHFFCFNGKDGSIKWMVDSWGTDSPPSIADADGDGKPEILDGDFYGQLVCYNAEDGSIVWKNKVDSLSCIQTEPVIEDIDGDGELDCVVATWSDSANKIVAYRIRDGKELWTCREPKEMLYHGPTIADIDEDGKMEVVIGSYDGFLYCLKGKTGEIKWKYNFPEQGYIGAPTTMGDINKDGRYEIAFVSGSKLGILDGFGTLVWDYDMTGYNSSFRGTIFSDMNNDYNPDVLFGTEAGTLIALNGMNGNKIYEYDLAKEYGKTFFINNAPVAADFNGDGNTEVFVIGGYTEYPAVEKSYGRAYMISVGKTTGPDWLMFRGNIRRNAVLPLKPADVEDNIHFSENNQFSAEYDRNEDVVRIKLNNSTAQFTSLILYDLTGTLIIKEAINSGITKSEYVIAANKLAVGAYIINLAGNNSSASGIVFKY